MAGGAQIFRLTQIAPAIRALIEAAGTALSTAHYNVSETSPVYSGDAITVKPKTGNAVGALGVAPKGTTQISEIDLYNAEDQDNAGILSISNNNLSAGVGTTHNGTGSDLPLNLYAGAGTGVTIGTDNSLTLTGALLFNASSIFKSTEQTGNGSAQNVAHGLGRVPKIFFAIPTSTLAAGAISATADATNVVVTATNTLKYIVVAL